METGLHCRERVVSSTAMSAGLSGWRSTISRVLGGGLGGSPSCKFSRELFASDGDLGACPAIWYFNSLNDLKV
jgi:hypothetical protein